MSPLSLYRIVRLLFILRASLCSSGIRFMMFVECLRISLLDLLTRRERKPAAFSIQVSVLHTRANYVTAHPLEGDIMTEATDLEHYCSLPHESRLYQSCQCSYGLHPSQFSHRVLMPILHNNAILLLCLFHPCIIRSHFL